jgi:hypothetical protein
MGNAVSDFIVARLHVLITTLSKDEPLGTLKLLSTLTKHASKEVAEEEVLNLI